VAALKGQLAALAGQGGLPGYKEIKVGKTPFQPNQAEAEYTYDGPNGPQHAVIHEYVEAGDVGYTLTWDTPEFDWSDYYAYYSVVQTSFHTT
jgi:hypothetical protein